MPLVWLAIGLVGGVLLSVELSSPWGSLVLLLVYLVGAYFLLRSVGIGFGLPLLLLVGVLVGLMRGSPGLLDPPGGLHLYHGGQVEVRGLVTDLPELVSGRLRLPVQVQQVRPTGGEWTDAQGSLLAWASTEISPIPDRAYPYVAYGDGITLEGPLEAPESFNGFDYPRYLAAQGIGSIVPRAQVLEVRTSAGDAWWLRQVQGLRTTLAAPLARVLPEPQGALSQALLLGRRGGLPPDLIDAFRRSGTSHILAISGLHVGIILGLSLIASEGLLGRRRNLYLLAPLLLMWTYALLAGASPSVMRASLMGSAYLLALATGRGTRPLNALAMAVILMLTLEPRWLWHLSFQLSFAAMTGVLVIGLPAWAQVRHRLGLQSQGLGSGMDIRRLGVLLLGWSLGVFLVSAGAVLGTLPLVAFNFHQVPLLGLLATLLMLPVLPGLIVGGFATAVLGLIWTPLGWAAAWLPLLLGKYTVLVAEAVAQLSWSVVPVSESAASMVWAYYTLLLGALTLAYRRRVIAGTRELLGSLWSGPSTTGQRAMALIVLAPLAIAPWLVGLARPDDLMHLYFLDVGQGDAALVRTPGGLNILIDGGPDERVTIPAVDRFLPLRDRDIDIAVLSHTDADHLNGLMALAQRGRIGMVAVPPLLPSGGSLWRRQLERAGVDLVEGKAGLTMDLADGVLLEFLHPPDPPLGGTGSDTNNNGVVARISFRGATALFVGDLEAVGEQVLLQAGTNVSAQVLKLPHHGSASSSTKAFLMAVTPSILVLSVGADNRFGHPSPETLARIEDVLPEHQLFDTSTHGTIELTTDGARWWVKTHP